MSRPANRTALRAEENRPAPPSQHVNASPVIGPTPYNRSASTRGPCMCRAVASSCRCRMLHLRLGRLQHQHRGGDLGPPRRRQLLGRDRGQLGPPGRGVQLRARRGALVEQHRVDPLQPRRVITAQVVVAAQQGPRLQHLGRRDPALRQPAGQQQVPLVAGIGPVGLGPPLTPPQVRGLRRLGQMRDHPRRGELLGDVPPPGAPLHRELDLATVVAVGEPPRQPGPRTAAGPRTGSAPPTPPRCRCRDSRT